MSDALPEALRILSHFWLEEARSDDLALISALPELADALQGVDAARLVNLAVDYQRLFGLNLPPYESVFVDPSAMLMAPATGRVRTLYQRAKWTPPATARAGAADHLGLELLALADWLVEGQIDLAHQLHTEHLALWVPAFVLSLARLGPHPFYTTLSGLTLDLLLATLPPDPIPADVDPFPVLPPPPTYHADGMSPPPVEPDEETAAGVRDVVRRLLTPRDAGVFITRQDILKISQTLELPEVIGGRFHMMENLFRLAGQYDLLPALFDQLIRFLDRATPVYAGWGKEYPAWTPYARAWGERVSTTRGALTSFREEAQLRL
jgi:TorA maturation chaperone TorD